VIPAPGYFTVFSLKFRRTALRRYPHIRSGKKVRKAFITRVLISVIFVFGSIAQVTSAFAAPITFNTALPVTEEQGIFRIQWKFLRSTGDPTPADRKLEVHAFPLVGVYGFTEKLAFFTIVPVIDKEIELNTPGGRVTRSTSGLGDITLLARYTIFQRDLPGKTVRVAPFLGIEIPTGDDDKGDSLGRLPQPLQLGSGSWDPSIGFVFTEQTLNWEFDSSASYKFNTEANAFEFGDVARLDLSYQYRIWPRKLGSGVPAFIYAVLESNLTWLGKNKFGGLDDRNSGGTVLNLAPGIQYVAGKFIVEGAVQFPLIQDLNGNALENDFITTLSIRINF